MTSTAVIGAPAVIALVISCLVAYFLCAIPFGYLIGKRMGKVDVRTCGSGNVGATNVARTVGKKAGILTLLFDILKAFASLLIARLILWLAGVAPELTVFGSQLDWMLALVYLCAILGHTFSPYLHFRGGKGIAVGFGGALGFMPWVALALWVPFLFFALVTRRVSVGSIAAAISLPFLAWGIYRPTAAFIVLLSVVAVLVVFSHRSNIVKLIHGQEKPFSFKKDRGQSGDSACQPDAGDRPEAGQRSEEGSGNA